MMNVKFDVNFFNLNNIASGGVQFMGSILVMAGIGKDYTVVKLGNLNRSFKLS